ncbi:MAG: dienelactone hydrolase family protein [Thiotrichales bacterium]
MHGNPKRVGFWVGLIAVLLSGAAGATPAATQDAAWWWDPAWWERGELEVPANHPVRTETVSYANGDTEVPAWVARPDDAENYPAVLFLHGRRGPDDLVRKHIVRLAARGFVVLAPDAYTARFIEKFPIEHDYALESDFNAGLDFLLARADVSGKRACLYSHTRGGYYALKVAVSFARQNDAAACFVSYYPHLQDPNAPEPMQVYRYATEVDALHIPTLIFVGEQEQYQRKRGIDMAIESLTAKGRPALLVTYPGVGRGFDFRPSTVRTFADDLAAKDAIQRAAILMRQVLVP